MAATETNFGKYSLILKIASGGQGEIHLARQQGAAGFEKLVVIKRLLPHLAEDAHFAKMLVDEARIAARIDHVNVCQVFELGQVGTSYYLAMEYLEGVPLSRILQHAADSQKQLDVRLVAAIMQQACEGLHHAHELKDADGELIGVVHRDMSPSNLFVTVDGYVKVLDFGVAKARGMESRTRTGTIKGKYEYMSPEQVLRRPLDRRSDVFSLGIVLYESLTVRRLFYRDTEFEVFRAITEEPITPLEVRRPDVPPALARVVHRTLDRDVESRYASARELRRALIDAVSSLGPPLSEEAIGEYVRTQFSDELEARRASIAANSARLEREGTASQLVSAGAPEHTGRVHAGEAAHGDSRQGLAPRQAQPATSRRARRRLLIWALLVAVAAAAGALAGILYYTRQPEPTPILVLQGEVTSDDGSRVTAPRPQESSPSARLGAHQAELLRCFAQHAGAEQPVAVVVAIDVNGRASDSWLDPRHLTDTAIGACLRTVVSKVDFGAQEQPTQVRIPIRLRTPQGT